MMFAALTDSLWKSRDGGSTWQRLTEAPGGITALGVHPGNSGVVFAGTREGRIFTTSDGGTSWEGPR